MATAPKPAPAPADAAAAAAAATSPAVAWLAQFIGCTLRIHVTDGRIFVGQMKCTDKDRNLILALTHEHRPAAPTAVGTAAAAASSGDDQSGQLPLTRRYVGLVVVPGRYIVRVEYETAWEETRPTQTPPPG